MAKSVGAKDFSGGYQWLLGWGGGARGGERKKRWEGGEKEEGREGGGSVEFCFQLQGKKTEN